MKRDIQLGEIEKSELYGRALATCYILARDQARTLEQILDQAADSINDDWPLSDCHRLDISLARGELALLLSSMNHHVKEIIAREKSLFDSRFPN